jgi:protoporphyrinogen oxidase
MPEDAVGPNGGPQAKRVASVRGGAGELMTASLLERALPERRRITIFEASDRLGGKIVTGRFRSAPVPYEAGSRPATIRNSALTRCGT